MKQKVEYQESEMKERIEMKQGKNMISDIPSK